MMRLSCLLFLVIIAASGCASTSKADRSAANDLPGGRHQTQKPVSRSESAIANSQQRGIQDGLIRPVSHEALDDREGNSEVADTPKADAADSHPQDGVLDEDWLVAEVVARNPSVQAMVAAWRAAAQRYPQVIALDDPMLDVSVGPGSWNDRTVESAYMVMASQKFPWHGKRRLRGEMANWEANGAASEIQDVQLRLAETARLAFYDYFAAHRDLALNSENLRETREFRDTAESKLRASLVTQQDVLQADVELSLLEKRRNELDRQAKVAAARINTLLHRDAAYPLPHPPERLADLGDVPSVEQVVAEAIRRRPDLSALAAQIQADNAAVELAHKEYYPDVELYAKYDAFWQEDPLRSAVGVNVNLPLNQSRRSAAVCEAQFRAQKRQAEYQRLVDEISNEVYASHERMLESRRTLALYNESILPAAEKNVASARAGYVSGKVDFLRLIEAQRQLIELREQQVETLADYHRRLAELGRAAAEPITTDIPGGR